MDKLNAQKEQLAKAVERLGEALALEQNDIVRDSAIQRFEFCTDLAWKTIKTYLSVKKGGIECRFPKDCIREAFAARLIDDNPLWFTIVDYRNLSSHTYSEKIAEKVASILPDALELFKELIKKMH